MTDRLSPPALSLQAVGQARLDGLIVSLDGPTISTRITTEQSLADQPLLDAIAMADRLVGGRIDRLTAEATDAVAWMLREHNQLGPIAFPELSPIDVGVLTDIEAWSGELYVGKRSTNQLGQTLGSDAQGSESRRLELCGRF